MMIRLIMTLIITVEIVVAVVEMVVGLISAEVTTILKYYVVGSIWFPQSR